MACSNKHWQLRIMLVIIAKVYMLSLNQGIVYEDTLCLFDCAARWNTQIQ
jgi:hypothetical protein